MRIPTIRLPDVKESFRYLSDLVYTLSRILTDIATQLNNLSEGRIVAATNAATAPPTTDAHQLGDFIRNSNPTVASDGSVLIGWVCTAAGSPGTWSESRTASGGELAGFRNLLINALGRNNIRGYVSGTATTAANQYTLDRFRVVVSGQSLGFAATGNGFTMTAPAGGVEQVIEGSNIFGGTYVLNWQGTATATVNGVAVAKRGTFTLPANTNATVRFIGGTFYLPQLEYGSVPSQFELRPAQFEELLCQFYACFASFGLGRADSATSINWALTFPRRMRAVPSLTIVKQAHSIAQFGIGTQTSSGSTFVSSFPGRCQYVAGINGYSGLSTGNICAMVSDDVILAVSEL